MPKEKGLEIGYIGLGQCGGLQANSFAKLGYKCIAINTTSTDTKLDHISEPNKLIINPNNSTIKGAGKNPEIGLKALEDNIEEVCHFIKQTFSSIKMVYICVGLGGGSGSGMVALLAKILIESDMDVGIIGTIPSKTECIRTKIVAISAFDELSQIEGLKSVFVIDNSKIANLPKEIGLKTKYNIINDNMAMNFDYINELCTLESEVSFDPGDFHTLLSSRGAAIISSVIIPDVTEIKKPEFLSQMLTRALKNSIYTDSDLSSVQGFGFLLELPKGGGNYLTEEAIDGMQLEFGVLFEKFYGIYESKERGSQAKLTILLTGLPFPFEQLNNLQKEIEDKASALEGMITKNQTQIFTSTGKSYVNKFISTPKPVKKNEESTLEKLIKKRNG